MEHSDILDANFNASLQLQAQDIAYLRTAGKWGRFLSITGLVIITLFVVILLFSGSTMLAMMLGGGMGGSEFGAAGAGVTAFVILIYGGMIALSAYLYYLLYKFSTNAIKAADSGNQQAITVSLKSLSTMFKIIGILLAIYLGMLAIGLVFALIGGVATTFF